MKKTRRMLAMVLVLAVIMGMFAMQASALNSTSKCPTCGSTNVTTSSYAYRAAYTSYVEGYTCLAARHAHITYIESNECTCPSNHSWIGYGTKSYTICGYTGNKVSIEEVA